ncbi:MAG: ABC transporter substrate-binding protein [Alphaproteobacteria bacterium]
MLRMILFMVILFAGSWMSRAAAGPARVVSLDYCADQYVMALVGRDRIAGVSPAAGSEYSYLAAQADGLPRVRPNSEAILLAEPDLVVRQYGGGSNAGAHLNRLGIPVAQIAFGTSLTVAADNLRRMGTALGAEGRATALLTQMDVRLERVRQTIAGWTDRPRALYLTPGGFTSGGGTFVDDILTRAGVRNMVAEQGRDGWLAVDLEQMVLEPPDMIVGAFFDLSSNHVTFWSLERHAFFRRILEETPTVLIPGRQVACSAWFATDAIETIHVFASGLRPSPAAQDRSAPDP